VILATAAMPPPTRTPPTCDVIGTTFFYDQLQLLAKEYERVQAENHTLTQENSRLLMSLANLRSTEGENKVAMHPQVLKHSERRIAVSPQKCSAQGLLAPTPDITLLNIKGDVDDEVDSCGICVRMMVPEADAQTITSDPSPEESPSLFPPWFDPPPDEDHDADVCQDVSHDLGLHQSVDPLPMGCAVISPLGPRRLTWDFLGLLCLLLETWLVPFELIFLQETDTPWLIQALSYGVNVFFFIDLLLNFNTGYIRGDQIVMERKAICKEYFRFFFWVDLLSTVPFDLILVSAAGAFSFLRVGKASKVFKVLRYLKFMRLSRLLRTVSLVNMFSKFFQHQDPVRFIVIPGMWLTCFLLFAHIHGCIWAALQPDFVAVVGVKAALRRYCESLWWGYSAISVGALGIPGRYDDPVLWTFEMVVATERIFIIAQASHTVVFNALTRLEDARRLREHSNALTYLRKQKVSFQTQLKAFMCLKDAANAKHERNDYQKLFSEEMAPHIIREMKHELWSGRLLSFGLIERINTWDTSFVQELAQLCDEQIIPASARLVRRGELATMAYCVIEGSLLVAENSEFDHVPPFTRGSWVGENALVSATLRHSVTFVTEEKTSVMVVPADRFQALISRLGLTQRFEQFCAEHLWRGLCGRCGVLGHHFSDTCISARNRARWAHWAPTLSLLSDGDTKSELYASSGIGQDVIQLLRLHDLERLGSTLAELRVNDLDALEQLDMGTLRSHLGRGFSLSTEQEAALCPASIEEFRKDTAREAHRALFQELSRLHHLVFLSHYKVEAGTEAALMRQEMQQAIADDTRSLGHNFDMPIFLDSDGLEDLEDLQLRVSKSHNLVILLTKDLLTRAWVLVEIVTAWKARVRLLPVKVSKSDCEFEFPDESFYEELRQGSLLDEDATKVLQRCGCSMDDLEWAVRAVFSKIALPYSPHKSSDIRKVEVATLLRQCRLKNERERKNSTLSLQA